MYLLEFVNYTVDSRQSLALAVGPWVVVGVDIDMDDHILMAVVVDKPVAAVHRFVVGIAARMPAVGVDIPAQVVLVAAVVVAARRRSPAVDIAPHMSVVGVDTLVLVVAAALVQVLDRTTVVEVDTRASPVPGLVHSHKQVVVAGTQ